MPLSRLTSELQRSTITASVSLIPTLLEGLTIFFGHWRWTSSTLGILAAYGTDPLATTFFFESGTCTATWHRCLAIRTRRDLAIVALEPGLLLESFHNLLCIQITCNVAFAFLAFFARCAAAYAACGAIRRCTLLSKQCLHTPTTSSKQCCFTGTVAGDAKHLGLYI